MTKPKQPSLNAIQHIKKKEKRSQYTLETERKDAIHRKLHDLFYTIPPRKGDTDDRN